MANEKPKPIEVRLECIRCGERVRIDGLYTVLQLDMHGYFVNCPVCGQEITIR